MKEDILGIKIEASGNDAISSTLRSALGRDEGCFSVFTPNATILSDAYGDKELTALLNSSDMNIPDGSGVILASRILRTGIEERFAGIEMGEYLLSLADAKGLRVYLLGGKDGVAKRAAGRLSKKYPNAVFCGAHHGYFDPYGAENERIIKEICDTSTAILFVCLGFPRQEKWISENKHKLPSLRIAAGLGGSLDVWSGDLRRAPRLMQRLSLEWLWRILTDYRRAVFLIKLPKFLFYVFLSAFEQKKRKASTKR